MKKHEKTAFILAAAFIVIIIGIVVASLLSGGGTEPGSEAVSTESDGSLKIWFPSLGKADCAVIYEDGCCIVIDCGNKGDGSGIAAKINSLGFDRIDMLFITHFDKDHIGGAAKLLTSVSVGTIYEPCYDDSEIDSGEYSSYRLAVEYAVNAGTKLVSVTEDLSLSAGNMALTVWHAKKAYDKNVDNNNSLVIRLVSREKTALFSGDIERQRIDDMIYVYDLKCDLLKMPHHGEYNKSTPKLIEVCSPSIAVITSSAAEPADTAALEALASAGVKTYLTVDGEVTFTVTEDGITADAD